MTQTQGNGSTTSAEFGARPRDDELDLFGITHTGKVRLENQDHFLVATVHPELIVHETSLPAADSLPFLRISKPMAESRGVGQRAETVPDGVRGQIDVHIPGE